MAHIRQSWTDSGLGFQVNVLQAFLVVPSSLGSGFPLSKERRVVAGLKVLGKGVEGSGVEDAGF